jgi:hypothetical protein
MPAPLVPADVDLRDFAFLPLDVVRLRDSTLAVEASGDEFRAAVLLWCVAWHQIPAASLPDDDRALAMYAGFGRGPGAVKDWKRVRAGALRGFVRCDDGRLYHAVLSEKAMEAAGRKEENASNKERQKRWRERMRAMCEELRSHGVTPPAGASATELETLLSATRNANANVTPVTQSNVTSNVTKMAGEGEGQGQGQGQEEQELESPNGDLSPPSPAATGVVPLTLVAGQADAEHEDEPDQPGRPPCPQSRIVALYHEILPELRQMREWNDTRRRLLGRRWAESEERQTLDWWREFFRYVRRSRFLMGKTIGRDGRPFDCDLEWLIKPTNFAKVVEGKYEDAAA